MNQTPRFVQLPSSQSISPSQEVAQSLTQKPASLSPKFFYNALGSKLFSAITQLPEYYPTRTEKGIVAEQARAIAQALPQDATLIDLGAGNCEKAAQLFDIIHPAHYVAIDISANYLKNALERLQFEHPTIQFTGVGMDFSSTLQLPTELNMEEHAPRVFFFPGSSINNFEPHQSLEFLKRIRQLFGPHPESGLFIGVDLVKPIEILEAAYDDPLGITAAFNRNALLNLNDLIGSNFKVQHWKHQSTYNPEHKRIEMHLQAQEPQTVQWSGHSIDFEAGHTIHTENSYKWNAGEFEQLLDQAGYKQSTPFTDPKNWFSLIWAQ